MHRLKLSLLPAICAALFSGIACAYDGPVVVDHANFLDGEGLVELSQSVKSLNAHADFFLVVLTVPTLEGEDADLYSRAVIKRWRIEHDGRGDGALLLIVKTPPMFHIASSPDVRGIIGKYPLTDITSALEISFEQKAYLGGLKQAINALAADQQTSESRANYLILLIPVCLLGLIAFANTANLRRRRCPHCGMKNPTSAVRCAHCLGDIWSESADQCPCGSGKSYEQCCLPRHLDGAESYRIGFLRFLDIRYYAGLSSSLSGFIAGGTGAMPSRQRKPSEFSGGTEAGGW